MLHTVILAKIHISKMNKCFRCKKDVEEDKTSFRCDGCKRLLHISCANVTSTEIRCLQLASETRKLKFFCNECEKGFSIIPMLKDMVEDLRVEVDKLKETNKQILEDRDKQIVTLNKEIEQLKQEKDPSYSWQDVLDELNERMNRVNNVIVYNVPESTSASLTERIENDKIEIQKVFNIVEKEELTNDMVKVIRIGRAGGDRPRPVKLVFSNNNAVKDILKNKKRLHNSPFKISSDLTKMQRKLNSDTWNNFKRRRDSGEDVYVRYRNGMAMIEENKAKKN